MSSIQRKPESGNRSRKWQHFDRVIRDPTISPAARTLFAILVSYSDSDGVCWPSLRMLMADLGYSNFGVRKLLNELLDKGAITKQRRGKMLTNVYDVKGECNSSCFHKEEGECNSSCGVSATPVASECNCGVIENDPRAYSDKASGDRNRSKEQPHRSGPLSISCDFKKSRGGGKKSSLKSSKSAEEKETDPRVQPVLATFYNKFKAAIGKEPTPQAFDWARDGRRVRELPPDYTAELLAGLIENFFKAPGYVRRNFNFGDFLVALPRLLTENYGPPTTRENNKGEQQLSYEIPPDFYWSSEES